MMISQKSSKNIKCKFYRKVDLFYSKNNLPFSRQNYSTLADCVACDYDEEDVALEFVAVALLI